MLINELALNLISRHGRPPQVFVEVVSSWLKNDLGKVDVATVLDDFFVDNFGKLGSGVLLGTVELEGLRSSVVIVQHALKSSSDINGLCEISDYSSSREGADSRERASISPSCGWRSRDW